MRIPIFALSVATSVCSFAAQMLALVSLPFLFQNSLDFSAVADRTADHALAARHRVRCADRRTPGRPLSGRACWAASGLMVFALRTARAGLAARASRLADIVWRMALMGAGFGLFQSPNNRAMLAAAPRERSGGASGMLGTARLLGQTTGAALVALLLRAHPAHGTRRLAAWRARVSRLWRLA